MMMKRSLFLLVVCVLGLQAHARATSEIRHWFAPNGNGTFSASAQNVCEVSSSASGDEIWSPNHLRKIVTRPSADGAATLFAVDEDGREFAIETAAWSCPEIGWSPTSTLFFATYSDGGAVGTYHVSAYRISAGRMEKIDLSGAVRRDFQRHYPKCDSPEEPNIAGVAWSVDSTKLLVAAQVLPHSNCDNMGTFNLYTVAVPNGKIIDRIPQLAAKTSLYDLLGQKLRTADDGCFSNVGSCWIPARHEPRSGK
jgi:hypothetical protein